MLVNFLLLAFHLLRVFISFFINGFLKGIYGCPRWLTSDGFEMQLQVNYLSHFLLTKRLLPTLSNNARIINVTSKLYESKWKIYENENLNFGIYINELNFKKRVK